MSERMGLSLLTFLTAFLLVVSPAQAHKLKTFATAIGAQISGYAYFAPGGRAQNASVTISREDGSLAAHMQTNEQGEFAYTADQRARFTIDVDAGDGHEASISIAASELPTSLPISKTQNETKDVSTPRIANAPNASDNLQEQIEAAVARQLRPLREQIDDWHDQLWLHDLLGGLGYIIGLAGLAYALTSPKRKPEANSTTKQTKS